MSTATYRFELAKSNRAGCQNSVCKNEKIKIDKGELRMGTLVTIKENTTWMWKHWGCVTPLQIKNLQSQVGPLEDLDLDHDLEAIIDGFDEIGPEAQEKIKFALINGHVPNEDWRGDPELNRPGQKGINKRSPKKKQATAEENGDAENPASSKTKAEPKSKRSRAKKQKVESENDDYDLPSSPVPKKRVRNKKVKAESEDEDNIPQSSKPATKGRGKKVKVDSDAETAVDEPPEAKPVSRKRNAAQAEIDAGQAVVKPKKSRTKVKSEPNVKAEPSNDDYQQTALNRSSASQAKDREADAAAEEIPQKGKRSRKVKVEAEIKLENDKAQLSAPPEPTKRRRSKKVKSEPESEVSEEDISQVKDEELDVPAPQKRKATAKPKSRTTGKGK